MVKGDFKVQMKNILLISMMLLLLGGCSLEPVQGEPTTPDSTKTAASAPAITTPVQTTAVATQLPMKPEDQVLISEWEDKIYPGTTIAGINVSGLTVEEAKKRFKKKKWIPSKTAKLDFGMPIPVTI